MNEQMDVEEEQFLPCSTAQLNLDVLLSNGQAFRWRREEANAGCWLGVAHHRLWRLRRVDSTRIGFQILHNFHVNAPNSGEDTLRQYFRLDVDLEPLYLLWASKCAHFKQLLAEQRATFEGIRILAQDPLEALFAFICSANNNIGRIAKMVDKLCELYGTRAEVKLNELEMNTFHDFPTLAQLAASLPGMERQLREAGFGYRAASIAKSVEKLGPGDEAERWLNSLKSCDYQEAHEQLLGLPGVGPKVADCICLMGLGMDRVVPVDRHILNLTAQIYKPAFLKGVKVAGNGSIGKRGNRQIGAFYEELFGDYAGWAQSILFSTRLRRFKKI